MVEKALDCVCNRIAAPVGFHSVRNARMTQMEITSDMLEQQCQQAVERVIARYQCYLLEPTEYTRRTVEYMRQGNADSPSKAAIGVYSLALYHACSGREGLDR